MSRTTNGEESRRSMLWAETVPLDINFSTIAKTPVEWPLSLSRTAAPPANFAVPISREEPEQDVAIHISMVGPVYYEPETLHVAVPFPLSEADLQRHATDMTLSVPRWLSHPIAVWLQLSADYASCVAAMCCCTHGSSCLASTSWCCIGQGVWSYYHKGPITKASLLRQADLGVAENFSVFQFGDLAPVHDGAERQAMQGGLIKVLRRGEVIDWAPDLQQWLWNSALWNPDVDTSAASLWKVSCFFRRLKGRSSTCSIEEIADTPAKSLQTSLVSRRKILGS